MSDDAGLPKTDDPSVFDRYGDIYDDIYSRKDYASEAAYVHRLIEIAGRPAGPSLDLLELGSGTGGHARAFTQLGYQVTGIERSASMIARANQHGGGPKYLKQDIRNLKLDQEYSAVVSLFHVLSYITDTNDLLEVFKQVRACLKSDGVFVFDFWYGPAVLSESLGTRLLRIDAPKRTICRINEPVFRSTENVVDIHFEIWSRQKDTGIADVFSEVHPMRYFFLPELKHLLNEAGFKTVESRLWLDETAMPELSDRNAVLWAKP